MQAAEGALHVLYSLGSLVYLIVVPGSGEVDHLRDVFVSPGSVLDPDVFRQEVGRDGCRSGLFVYRLGN